MIRPRRRIKNYLAVCLTLLWLLSPAFFCHAQTASQSPVLPRHKIQVSDPALAGRLVAGGARLIADYGAFQIYDADQAAAALAGQAAARDNYNLILLNAARLDTSLPEIQSLRKAVGAFAGKRLHLIQFAGPPLPAWREDLLQAGAQIVSYIPLNACLVYGDSAAIARLQSLAAQSPHIQWDAAYRDDYKIHPAARSLDAKGNPRQIGTEWFAVQMVADAGANAQTLQLLDRLKLEPLRPSYFVLNYLNIVGRFRAEDLALISGQPEVVSILPYFTPRKMDERQDQIVAGSISGDVPSGPGYLAWLQSKGFTQAQFDASDFIVDLADSGIDNGTTSPNHFGLYINGQIAKTNSRVAYNRLEGTPNPPSTLKGCDGHGNLNAHIIAGYDNGTNFPFEDSSGYHYGLGVCPFVRLGSSVVFDPADFTYPNYTTLESAAYQSGARIDNNSWGGETGIYDSQAQEYDALVRDADPSKSGNHEMVIVFAVGNDPYPARRGPQPNTVTTPGTAKNVITVGATEGVQALGGTDGCGWPDAYADDANQVPFFSGEGPCDDGRHKPDIMAPGTHISGGVIQADDPGPDGTADSCFTDFTNDFPGEEFGVCGGVAPDLFFPAGQQFYTTSTGTSHSTPCVSGGCALLRQYFINEGLPPPSPAMTKAYLMNSARYLTGSGADDTLWSDVQGMGEMDLGVTFDGAPRIQEDESAANIFTATGQTRTFSGSIADTNKPFRVTLAWTDAPGSTTAASAANNDLDLTVTVGGVAYIGNVFNGAYSVPGGAPDTLNNVESVFLPAGTSGPFTILVTAANINSVGVPNSANALQQDFALVAYNVDVITVPPPTILSPVSGFISNNPSLTVVGAGLAAARVSIYDGVVFITNATVNSAGKFSSTFKLGNGAHSLTAIQTQDGVPSLPSSPAVLVTLTLTPVISVQPQNQTNFLKASVTFLSGATGASPLKYYWEKNGVKIAGADSPSLTLHNITAASVASYRMVATNKYGSATSSNAAFILVPNPFTNLTGNYAGLFSETPPRFPSSGLFTLDLTSLGAFTGKILNAGGSFSFAGAFPYTGHTVQPVSRGKTLAPLTLILDLTNDTEQILGVVSNANWLASLQADRASYSAAHPAPQSGNYTMLLATGSDGSASPGGNGFAKVTVSPAGMISLRDGLLSDNTAVAPAAVSVSKYGQWPLYIPLYGKEGSLSGWVNFTDEAGLSFAGSAGWFRTNSSGKLYPRGFTNDLSITGSTFAPGSARVPSLDLTNLQITLSGSGLPVPLTNNLTLTLSGKFLTNGAASGKGISKLALSVVPATGLVSGSFSDPVTDRPASIKGILFQQQTNGGGFFLGANMTGSFFLGPPQP
ncbi:MAG: S8 family serine peptidase [Verrucomicrobiota bacterium]|jgi:hypothetical protein